MISVFIWIMFHRPPLTSEPIHSDSFCFSPPLVGKRNKLLTFFWGVNRVSKKLNKTVRVNRHDTVQYHPVHRVCVLPFSLTPRGSSLRVHALLFHRAVLTAPIPSTKVDSTGGKLLEVTRMSECNFSNRVGMFTKKVDITFNRASIIFSLNKSCGFQWPISVQKSESATTKHSCHCVLNQSL